MRDCNKCRFCCWSFAVHDVPDAVKGIENKPVLTHCQHECDGCAIHEQPDYPAMCASFICPYLAGDDIHSPVVFQPILERAAGSIGNYIPAISARLPVAECEALIEQTRSLPAAILIDNNWFSLVMPLDKDEATWRPDERHIEQWAQAYARHGVEMPESMRRILTLC